jgi:hypothetical protein
MATRKDVGGTREGRDKPVSLAPLKPGEAIAGLFAIPNPEATKPKRKKGPATPKE